MPARPRGFGGGPGAEVGATRPAAYDVVGRGNLTGEPLHSPDIPSSGLPAASGR